MKQTVKILFLLIFLVSILGCESGDRTPPGDINDLTFFTDPKALEYLDGHFQLGKQRPPAKTFSLAWTAPGDNGSSGKAAIYDLRYITDTEIEKYGLGPNLCDRGSDFLHSVFNEPHPQKAGEKEILSLLDQGFKRGATYHFCLWTIDETGQASDPAYLQATIPVLGFELSAIKGQIPGLGARVSELGDLNRQGLTEISAASLTQGEVLIYLGRKYDELFWSGELFERQYRKTRTLFPKLHIFGNPAESFGFVTAKLGDPDKNHKQDFAITAPDAATGKIFLFHYGQQHSLTSADAWSEIDGEAPGDHLGFALSACNDINMDGYPDFVVSAPDAGKVYVVLGGSTAIPLGEIPASGSIAAAASVLIQGDPSWGFGSSLACGSDLNGDAIPDLLIGAGSESAGQGAAYILFGGTVGPINFGGISNRGIPVLLDLTAAGQSNLKISGAVPGEKFGGSVAMVGDIFRRSIVDSSRDFAVGAGGTGTGTIYVFFGGVNGNLGLNLITTPTTGVASAADLILTGKPGEIIGEELAGKGDLNRDGHFDLASSNGAGGVRVFYLLPVNDPDKIKGKSFHLNSPITGFAFAPGFYLGGKTTLLIGAAGTNDAYILR